MPHETPPPAAIRAAALDLREVLVIADEHLARGGGTPEQPGFRVAVAAVVANPLAGSSDEDLGRLVELGGELGQYLAQRTLRVAEGAPILAVGRAATVGQDGELEHAAALIGPAFNAAVRKAVGASRSSSPSLKKVGGPGSVLEVSLHYVEGASGPPLPPMEVRVPGHPRDDEAVVVLAVAQPASG